VGRLQKWCDENGYLLAIDPGSDASIGGYLSTGASGTLTPKYGTVRENVVRLRIVLPGVFLCLIHYEHAYCD
jgi:D-lactate dehydrogenase (cytochrome)